MGAHIKHEVASGVVAGLALLFGLAPAVSAATINDSNLYAAADKAVAYLVSQQQPDGSLAGFGGEADWAAIALAAQGTDVTSFKTSSGASLADFLAGDQLTSATSVSALERRILAIKAIGEDPASFGGTDYESLLLGKFDGTQIGDAALVNDDIWGIMALVAINNPSNFSVIQSSLDFLIDHQDISAGGTGGFSYSADLTCQYCSVDSNDTAAALVAIEAAQNYGIADPDLDAAKVAAEVYLKSTIKQDGGFGADQYDYTPSDGSSTAWGLIALNTIGDSADNDIVDGARSWLLSNQNNDNGFGYVAYNTVGSDTYTTPHAMIALLGTNWLLNPAPIARPTAPATGGQGGDESDTNVTEEPSVAETHPIIPYVSNGPATPAPVEQVAAAETDTPNTDQVTEDSNSPSNQTLDNKGSILKYIGYGLIVLAVAGLAGYTILTRQSNDKG